MKTQKKISMFMPFGRLYKSTLALLAAAALTGGMATAAHAQNLLLNGDFTANASSFTTFPGNISLGSNPAGITDWYQIVGGGPVGVNGAGVGFSGPFGPTADGGLTYAFVQSGVNGLAQNISGLAVDTTYQLSFDAAARAGNNSVVFRVQIGDATSVFMTTQVGGSDVLTGNPNAFDLYNYTFTTPSSFNGGPSIQLYNLTPGDNTIDFANITLANVPEPTSTALLGLGIILMATLGRWRASIRVAFGRLTHPSMKLLAAVALAGGMTTAAFAQDSITVANPSFENAPLPTGFGLGIGAIPGWNGGTGVAGTGNPFWDNGAAVDGSYVGFKQKGGLTGQPTSGYQVGQTYWIQFFANSRNSGDTCDIAVFDAASTAGGAALISGVNIPIAGGSNPFTFINVPFTAAATTGDLNILNTPHAGLDATLLMDGFSVIRRSPNDVVIANPSFEASGTGQASPGYVSAIAGWTIKGAPNACAINQAGGTFADNGTIPDGGNVLCVTSGAGLSQTLSVYPGFTYQLSLYVNSQAAGATPTALVTIGGNTAYNASVTAVGGSNPYQFVTYTFNAASTNVTLTISNVTGSASALLVDNVRLIKQVESINVANPSFEQGYNSTLPHYGTPSGWASSSPSPGINDVTGPFWDNGAAVDGTYVGFVQNDGLLGQPTTGFQVGQTYWIQFFANARIGSDSPDVAVFESASTAGGAALVSGINITPVGGAAGTGNPFTFINIPFVAGATNGDLNINKTSHSGTDTGNATLLLDGFSIIRRTTNDIVIQNPSFEASGTGQPFPGTVGEVAGWTFTTTGGGGPPLINQNGGPYLDNGEVVPEGNNALVIQNVCAYSQVLHGLTVGKWYRLTLLANSRHNGAANALITIDGKTAYNAPVPILGSQPWQVISYDFPADATDVTLSIGNTTATTFFVDDVRVYAPTPVAPSIVTQPTPTNTTRYAGLNFTLTASVSGYPAPTLHWQHNGSNIAGATNATLTLNNLQTSDTGSYVLTATNSVSGTNSSAATLTVLPVNSAYASAVIAQNPMGYWRFSDGGGTNAYDYAGGNNAYDTNYAFNAAGNGGSGLPASLGAGPQPASFPGFETTNTAPFLDGLSQGYSSSVGLFNNRSNFTILGWFNINPSQYPIITDPFIHPQGRASLFGQQWAAELGIYQGTNLYFYATSISATIFANTNLVPGVWNFVAAVSDATANTTTLYLNGAVVGTASACPGTANSYLFSIGKNVSYFPSGGYDNAFFPGSLDEVAAFDHPLTTGQIQALYQTSVTVASVSPTNVVAKIVNISGVNNVVISGAGGSSSSGYTVLTTTNLTTPLASWFTNATGLPFGAGGSVNYTNPINSATPQLFYRIRVP